MVLISVEGLIGAGKSLLCEILKDHDFTVVVEPVEMWDNAFTAFYNDPKKYACMFQTLVLRTRVDQLREISNGFVERCVHSDKLFGTVQHALKNMDDIEYCTYLYQYNQAVTDTKTIHGYIYVKTSVDTCIKRIDQRNREGESGISKDYLRLLEAEHEKWLNNEKNVLIIDGEADFRSPDVVQKIVSQINYFTCKSN